MHKHSAILKQLFLYGIVGVTTLAIDVSVTTALYNLAHLPAYVASALGFLSGFAFNFPINRKNVFHHSANDRFSLRTQITMFSLLSLFNLGITSLTVDLLVVHHIVRIAVAKLVITAIIAVWNFIILKTVIFSKRTPTKGLDARVLNDIL